MDIYEDLRVYESRLFHSLAYAESHRLTTVHQRKDERRLFITKAVFVYLATFDMLYLVGLDAYKLAEVFIGEVVSYFSVRFAKIVVAVACISHRGYEQLCGSLAGCMEEATPEDAAEGGIVEHGSRTLIHSQARLNGRREQDQSRQASTLDQL